MKRKRKITRKRVKLRKKRKITQIGEQQQDFKDVEALKKNCKKIVKQKGGKKCHLFTFFKNQSQNYQ